MMPLLKEPRKFFKSLNCAKCESPFCSTANERRTPRVLHCCQIYICHECFEDEKARKLENRWHQCYLGDEYYQQETPVYSLMQLISADGVTLNQAKKGYYVDERFKVPECPICHEDFEAKNLKRTPLVLYCQHDLCMECYVKLRKVCADPADDATHIIVCPICQEVSAFGTVKRSEGPPRQPSGITAFLLELPEMIEESKMIRESELRCSSCREKFFVDFMFVCWDCKLEICGACAYRKHQGHKANDLTNEEAKALTEELGKFSLNQIETYEKIFPELHENLIKKISNFKGQIMKTVKDLPKIEKYDDLVKQEKELRKLGENFEELSEEYLPSLRSYDAKLQKLLDKTSVMIEDEEAMEKVMDKEDEGKTEQNQ